jgi:hypothetical protein
MQQALGAIQAVQGRLIPRESGIELVMLFLEIEADVAGRLIGPEPPEPEPMPLMQVPDEEENEALEVANELSVQLADMKSQFTEIVAGLRDGMDTATQRVMLEVNGVRESGQELGDNMLTFAQGVMKTLSEFSDDTQRKIDAVRDKSTDRQIIVQSPSGLVANRSVEESEEKFIEMAEAFQGQVAALVEHLAIPPVVNLHVEAPVVTVESPEVKFEPEIIVDVPTLEMPNVEVVMPSRPAKQIAVVEHDDGTKSTITSEEK